MEEYVYRYAQEFGPWRRASFDDALAYANSLRQNNETLYLSDHDTRTLYVYVLFYDKIDPRIFRKTVVYAKDNSEWRPVEKFANYSFVLNTSELSNPIPGALYLVRENQVEKMVLPPESVRRDFKYYSVIRI